MPRSKENVTEYAPATSVGPFIGRLCDTELNRHLQSINSVGYKTTPIWPLMISYDYIYNRPYKYVRILSYYFRVSSDQVLAVVTHMLYQHSMRTT